MELADLRIIILSDQGEARKRRANVNTEHRVQLAAVRENCHGAIRQGGVSPPSGAALLEPGVGGFTSLPRGPDVRADHDRRERGDGCGVAVRVADSYLSGVCRVIV